MGSALVWGCGDDDGMSVPDGATPEDASVADGGVVYEVDPPAEAALPDLGPCPSGWRTTTVEEGVIACEPWPESGRATCAAPDEAHFAGGDGCVRIGTECPAGEFPTDLPAGATIRYVSAAATGPGTGAIDQPFVTIRDAALGAFSGSIIAVGKGTYDEVLSLRAGVTIVGACVSETIIRATAPSASGAVLEPAGSNVTIKNLRIGPSARFAVLVNGAGRSLTIEDSVIEGATSLSLVVANGAELTLRRVAIRDAVPAADGRFGRGLELGAGTHTTLEDVVIERVFEDAIFVAGAGATLDATGVTIDDVAARQVSGEVGHGISLQDGATATVSRCVVERAHEVGMFATGAGTSATLDQCVVRDTRSRTVDGVAGRGVDVNLDATIVARRVLLERNREVQALAGRRGSLTLEDTIVREGLPEEGSPDSGGQGILARDTGTTVVARTLVADSAEFGVSAVGVDSSVTAEDLVVVDTHASAAVEPYGGFGLAASEGGAVEVTRGRFERNQLVSVISADSGSRLVLEDATIRDTRARADGDWGRGLNVQDGATAILTRALFERNREYAVQAHGSTVTLSDLVVRDTLARDSDAESGAAIVGQSGASITVTDAILERYPSVGVIATDSGTAFTLERVLLREGLGEEVTGFFGRGIAVQLGATLTGTDVRIIDQRDLGIFVGGANAVLTMDGLEVANIAGRLCATTTCTDEPFGFGVGVYDDAMARLSHFSIHDVSLCGVQVAEDGGLDLEDGDVTRAVIGACVQVDGYDVSRLSQRVGYRDNGANLESTSLPVPAGVMTLPGDG